jgi:hypothetical protein
VEADLVEAVLAEAVAYVFRERQVARRARHVRFFREVKQVPAVGFAIRRLGQDPFNRRFYGERGPDKEECDEGYEGAMREIHPGMISNAFRARRSDTGMRTTARSRYAIFAFAVMAAGPASADDGARISRLESEIQQLRAQVDEQDRRIQRLEAELARRSGTPPASAAAKPGTDDRRISRPAATGPQPWHARANWERVAKGLSAGQVTAILGEPTAVESIDGFKTLFYRGATPGGTTLNGLVNLRDDRVVAVVPPAF